MNDDAISSSTDPVDITHDDDIAQTDEFGEDVEGEALPFNDTPEDILLSRIESLVFVYPEPITVRRLARILSLDGKRVRSLLKTLQEYYQPRGIQLVEISGGFHFVTHPDNAEVIRTVTSVKPMKMTRPALETLAIVAYKQPCTRADVEDVRRVDCGGTLKFLFEKGLIRVLGRKEEPGRPIIYGTSNTFLELFNLKSLTDLPSLREFTELWDEHQTIVEEETGTTDIKKPVNRELFDTSGLSPRTTEPGPADPPAPDEETTE